jgi:hypothetical protein
VVDASHSQEGADPVATPCPTVASKPRRLGSAYARLWAGSSVSHVGDGIYYTALPLLAATTTRDPLRVATVEVAGQLPWLLFAIILSVVSREQPRLERANGRLSFAVSATVLATIPGHFSPVPEDHQYGRHPQLARIRLRLRVEILQGLRLLGGNRLLRTLALMNAASGLAFAAWTAILVLFAHDRLGIDNLGYGLLWTAWPPARCSAACSRPA